MAKKRDPLADDSETELSLWGRKAAERFDDDDLAGLGRLANLEKCVLGRQLVTRLPAHLDKLTKLTELHLMDMPSLESIDGIDQLTSLQKVSLENVANLDLERAFRQLAELPELVSLELGGDVFVKMPAAVAKLHSVVEVGITDCPRLDFFGAFKLLGKLAHLRVLSVIQRSRMNLPDAFAPLRQVRDLELLFYMKYLPPSIGAMASLERLQGERNYFTALPATFGKLAKLKELDLRDSKIATLPDEICDCEALETLVLSGNPLKALPARIGNLANLAKLDLRFTKLKTLPASIGELAALRSLSLPDTVTEAPDGFFALELVELSAAESLQARAKLGPVPTPDEDELCLDEVERIPEDLGQPIELTLRMQELDRPLPQLAKLRKLRELELEIGDLDHVLPHLAKVATLTQITLEGDYKTLPPSIGAIASLQTLIVTAPLTALPRELANLKRLAHLRLITVKLAALPEVVCELSELAELVVMSPPLAKLPKSIGKLGKLAKLELRDADKLAELPAALAQCRALAELSIGRDNLEKTPLKGIEILGELPALKRLWLRHVRFDMKALCRALADKPLELIALPSCELRKLPKEIGLLAKVVELDLTYTEIATLPEELAQCTALRRITLSKYQLDADIRNRVKDFLPPGRWKKDERRGRFVYARSD